MTSLRSFGPGGLIVDWRYGDLSQEIPDGVLQSLGIGPEVRPHPGVIQYLPHRIGGGALMVRVNISLFIELFMRYSVMRKMGLGVTVHVKISQ